MASVIYLLARFIILMGVISTLTLALTLKQQL